MCSKCLWLKIGMCLLTSPPVFFLLWQHVNISAVKTSNKNIDLNFIKHTVWGVRKLFPKPVWRNDYKRNCFSVVLTLLFPQNQIGKRIKANWLNRIPNLLHNGSKDGSRNTPCGMFYYKHRNKWTRTYLKVKEIELQEVQVLHPSSEIYKDMWVMSASLQWVQSGETLMYGIHIYYRDT